MRVSKYLFCAKCDRKTSLMAAKLTVIGHICQISPIVNKVFDVLLHITIWDFSSNTHLKIRTENQNNRLCRHKCSMNIVHPCYLQIQAFMYGWLTFYHQVRPNDLVL